jgi:two-component system chemotaxis response regulator CheY
MKVIDTLQIETPADALTQGRTHPAHRILVVDEDPDLRLLYSDALPDCFVDGAEDGAAGWEALQANHYDLLITDHDMPNVSGVELIGKVHAAHMALPVIMATGRFPEHELAQNPVLQLAGTLLKPFTLDTLLDTVRSVLRKASPKGIHLPHLSASGHAWELKHAADCIASPYAVAV